MLLCACALDRTGLGDEDAGDAGGTDAFVPPGDSGGVDAGGSDAGGTDAFVPPVDGGTDGGPGDAGVDAGPGDAGCDATWNRCADGIESLCDPGTGTLVSRTCPAGCSTEPRCARVAPSNVAGSLFDPAAADVTVSTNTSWNTGACSEPGMSLASQGDGTQVCVLRTGAFTVSARLRVAGDWPLIVLAEGAVDVSGTIDVSAYVRTTGPGGYPGGVRAHQDGYGPNGGGGGEHRNTYEDGGGGGGGMCGTGGAGGVGEGASGGDGGGTMDASWALEPLHGGSGGGLGQGAAGSSYDNNGYGGAGGGALQITSQASITVSGTILAGGGGGDPGKRTTSGSTNYGAGGGGGAGGAVLLEAPTVSFTGGGAIVATGGGGGGSASDGGAGAPGQDGAETADRASGGARGGSLYGARGGDSGGGTTTDGDTGDSNTGFAGNGGGGGGAVGCVVIRQESATLPADTSGFSPRVAPALRALPLRVD